MLVEIDATGTLAVPARWSDEVVSPTYPHSASKWLRATERTISLSIGERLAALEASPADIYDVALLELSIAVAPDAAPKHKFRAHIHLFDALLKKALLPSVAPHLCRIIEHEWRAMAERTFALRSPRISKPMLLDACDKTLDDKRKIAGMLQAAGEAIGASYPTWVRDLLSQAAS
jgi:hypothetical protein